MKYNIITLLPLGNVDCDAVADDNSDDVSDGDFVDNEIRNYYNNASQ